MRLAFPGGLRIAKRARSAPARRGADGASKRPDAPSRPSCEGRGAAAVPPPALTREEPLTEKTPPIQPGSPAPPFALEAQSGERHCLGGFRGRRGLVLYFMRAFT